MKRHLLYLTPVALALVFSSALIAAHYSPNGDSADGTEIRWEDATKYDDARIWGIDKWNARGEVSILPDTWYVVTDLEFEDRYYDDVTWAARRVVKWGSPDHIEFNEYYMDNYTTFEKRGVSVHELGHALGLGDHTTADYGSTNIIMYYCSRCSGVNTPQAHDDSDYYAYW